MVTRVFHIGPSQHAPCPATVCAEAYNPDEDEDEDAEPRVVNPKTDEQRRRLQDACKHILLFKTLDQVDKQPCTVLGEAAPVTQRYCPLQEQFSEILDAMFEVLVKPQQHIIDQGDDGDNFYVIET